MCSKDVSKAIVVIPARWGSTRLPGKALINILGKPLLQWVFERASMAKLVSEVIVATDDDRIFNVARDFGAKVVMTSSDCPSGTDRVAEVASKIETDIVVNVQGDEPTISPDLIDELIFHMHNSPHFDMVTAASPIESIQEVQKPSVCKVVFAEDGRALYFSRAIIPYIRNSDFKIDHPVYFRHIGIYLYKKDFLLRLVKTPPCEIEKLEALEQLRALYIGGKIKVVITHHVGIGVDIPEDVAKAEEALRKILSV